jgi:hypothetical protein
MKNNHRRIAALTLIALALISLGGCKSGGERLRELGAAHSKELDAAFARHAQRNAECKADAACLDAERKRLMTELTVLIDRHHAQVLALVHGL